MSWRSRIVEAVLILIAVAVAARVVAGLLGPLIPSLLALLVVGFLIFKLVAGPRSRG